MDANKNTAANDMDSWFANKFGPRIAKAKPKEDVKANQKEKMSIGRYKNVRKQIEEQLAARRHEDMQRRHRFYNADNELSNQNDDEEEEEEEEEEFTDEEEEEIEKKSDTTGKTADANGDGDASQERGDNLMTGDDAEEAEEMEATDEVDDEQSVADDLEDESDVSNAEEEEEESEETVDADDDETLMEIGSGDDKAVESKSKRRRRGSSQISSASKKGKSRKRPRLISSSSDDSRDGTSNDASATDAEPVRLAETVPCSGNEFSHISLDLNAATTAVACSQDFNEALFLCSGTFGDNDEAPAEKKAHEPSRPSDRSEKLLLNHDDDLFTVEDDEEAKAGPAGGDGWPIKWVDDDDGDDEEKAEEQEDESGKEIRRKPIKMKDILDDEASLSGDDVGGDSDESDGEEDEYEPEAGDDDELPDEEVIREKLVRQYIKQTNDDDERRMIQLQEQFFVDSDLHSATNMDRSFRFRMRDDANVDWNKLLGTVEEEEKKNSDNEDDEESVKKLAEKKVEMLKWRLEMEKKKRVFNDSINVEYVEMFETSSLLMLGEKSIGKKVTKTNSSEINAHRSGGTGISHTPKESELVMLRTRDSLLNKADALRHVIKETTTTVTTTHSLFTALLKK